LQPVPRRSLAGLDCGAPAALVRARAAAARRGGFAGNAAERALAAYALGRPEARQAAGNGFQAAALALTLDDPYSAVRLVAYRALLEQPGFSGFSYDFLAPPAERSATAVRAFERAGKGSLDQARIGALRARRDETPITLAE
jgi:hypothetical protein